MSADWFCKIGEKKVGPLSAQQLKTIVAKGQLKPEHLVRRGSEGPWVPAGRIKGLFPEAPAGNAQSKDKKPPQSAAAPLPKAAAKPPPPPTAKAVNLPIAAEAPPAPPVADIPQELTLGGQHKHHVEMNVANLNFEMTTVPASRRKVKAGLQGLKKDEQKKLTILLLCFIGGGTTLGLAVFIWAAASGRLFNPRPKPAEDQPIMAQSADSGKKAEKAAADSQPAEQKERENWLKASIDETPVGNVEVKVLKPTLGPPPAEAKTKEGEVLIVPVKLNLKQGEKKPVELTSWADNSLRNKVTLKDDQKRSYDLLAQVPRNAGDGKTITDKWLIVDLIFEAPTGKNLKFLHLVLPASAFHAGGTMIRYEINPNDIRTEAAKATKSDEGAVPPFGAGESKTGSDEKKPGKAKAADADGEAK